MGRGRGHLRQGPWHRSRESPRPPGDVPDALAATRPRRRGSSALEALEILYHYPFAHFFLGVALRGMRTGIARRGRSAPRISLNPNFPGPFAPSRDHGKASRGPGQHRRASAAAMN